MAYHRLGVSGPLNVTRVTVKKKGDTAFSVFAFLTLEGLLCILEKLTLSTFLKDIWKVFILLCFSHFKGYMQRLWATCHQNLKYKYIFPTDPEINKCNKALGMSLSVAGKDMAHCVGIMSCKLRSSDQDPPSKHLLSTSHKPPDSIYVCPAIMSVVTSLRRVHQCGGLKSKHAAV